MNMNMTNTFEYTMEKNSIANIDVNDIEKIYEGKTRTCYCGCAGTYYETPEEIEMMFKKFIRKRAIAEFDDDYAPMYTKTSGGKNITIYMKQLNK